MNNESEIKHDTPMHDLSLLRTSPEQLLQVLQFDHVHPIDISCLSFVTESCCDLM